MTIPIPVNSNYYLHFLLYPLLRSLLLISFLLSLSFSSFPLTSYLPSHLLTSVSFPFLILISFLPFHLLPPYFFISHNSSLCRQKAGNISDPSLFIYYNFDEGPGSTTIKNYGEAGSVADLDNGKVFNGDLYYELISKELRVPVPGYWVCYRIYLFESMS